MGIKELEARKAELVESLDNGEDVDLAEVRQVTADLESAINARNEREEARSALAGLPAARPEPEIESRTNSDQLDVRSMTTSFVQDNGFNAFREAVQSRRSNAEWSQTFDTIETRDLIKIQNLPFSQPYKDPELVRDTERRELLLAQKISTVPISTDAFEYVRYHDHENKAAVVPEGNLKPETTFTWERVVDVTRTVAHWVDISEQALQDERQVESIVRDELFFDLADVVDFQIVNGDGLNGTMLGIRHTPGVNEYAPSAAEQRIRSIRKAKTLVRKGQYRANVVVLNAEDWETIELSETEDGHWKVAKDVQGELSSRVWGMDVVESDAVEPGEAIVGDFRRGVKLYDRQRATLASTNSDGEKFKYNILTLRAELRLGLAVKRPKALAFVEFNGAE